MVEKKLTHNNSYKEVCDHIKSKGWSNDQVADRCYWFKKHNVDSKYDEIIEWLKTYLKENNKKTKITKGLAIEYKEKYGASKAIVKLKEDLGIEITRQGLYCAIKRKD